MSLSVLFWNLRKMEGSKIRQALARYARRDVDVFIFAEAGDNMQDLLATLNQSHTRPFSLVQTENTRLRFFSRLPNAEWREQYVNEVNNRIAPMQLILPSTLSLLLVGAHLDAPNYLTDNDRAEEARVAAGIIRTVENDLNHQRTLLVGDLNLNPYDQGLVQASALHGVMTRGLVHQVARHQSRHKYPAFYNPMWSLLGDWSSPRTTTRRVRPAGTFYYANTKAKSNTFWHLYDQVLLRPCIMHSLEQVKILTHAGKASLLTRAGRPNTDRFSDHLPLYFKLQDWSRGVA